MATIQDRNNPSRKVRVTSDGELVITGSGSGGAIVTTSSAEEKVLIDDYTTTDVTYICYAPIGSSTASAVWKIFILDETGSFLIKKYADGNSNYDNIADNRSSLSYS